MAQRLDISRLVSEMWVVPADVSADPDAPAHVHHLLTPEFLARYEVLKEEGEPVIG